jgi:hypothetical protein
MPQVVGTGGRLYRDLSWVDVRLRTAYFNIWNTVHTLDCLMMSLYRHQQVACTWRGVL